MEFIFKHADEAADLWRYFYKIVMHYGCITKADLFDYDPSLFATCAEQRNYTWNFYGWTSTNDISIDHKYVDVKYGDMLAKSKKKVFVVTLAEPKRLEL